MNILIHLYQTKKMKIITLGEMKDTLPVRDNIPFEGISEHIEVPESFNSFPIKINRNI